MKTETETALTMDIKARDSVKNLSTNPDWKVIENFFIKKYNEASEKEETLSVANKAYRLIDVGFIDEAKKILKEAQQKEDVHPNVNEALVSISKKEEGEGVIEENLIKEASVQRDCRLHQGCNSFGMDAS